MPDDIRKLIKQVMRFGSVGVLATLANGAIYAGLTAFFGLQPLLSNLLAFLVAFALSFQGHFHWTFGDDSDGRRHKSAALPRFLIASLLGLCLNSLIVYLIVHVWTLSYLYALFGFVFVTPPVLFLINRFWAFYTPRASRTD